MRSLPVVLAALVALALLGCLQAAGGRTMGRLSQRSPASPLGGAEPPWARAGARPTL